MNSKVIVLISALCGNVIMCDAGVDIVNVYCNILSSWKALLQLFSPSKKENCRQFVLCERLVFVCVCVSVIDCVVYCCTSPITAGWFCFVQMNKNSCYGCLFSMQGKQLCFKFVLLDKCRAAEKLLYRTRNVLNCLNRCRIVLFCSNKQNSAALAALWEHNWFSAATKRCWS